VGVERIQGTPERVIVEMAGFDARGDEASGWFILKKMWHEVELLVDEAQAIEDHGLDGIACGHQAHFRVLLSGLINDLGDAEFFKHARNQAKVIYDLRAVWLRLRLDVRAI
jgi:hypothetical protein